MNDQELLGIIAKISADTIQESIEANGGWVSYPKPPLGVMPRWRWDELNNYFTLHSLYRRLFDVGSAMKRYQDVNLPIPSEWEEEYKELRLRCAREYRWMADPLNLLRRW